ncbi:MAG: hypothetical protein GTO14_09830 [Anaerolineales bacterium]|nr:hypothetical protein [Anaerolineales bacterium]
MTDDPCKKEKEEARKASEAWELAMEEARPFMVERPLGPGESIEPKSPDYLVEMQAAFEKEAKAREAYIAAMTAWSECEEGAS